MKEMERMDKLQEIKNGIKSKNQDEWITFDDIDWLIKQVEKVEALEEGFKGQFELAKELGDKNIQQQKEIERLENRIELLERKGY